MGRISFSGNLVYLIYRGITLNLTVLMYLGKKHKTQYLDGGFFFGKIIDPIGHLLFYNFCKILFCITRFMIIVQYENGFITF